MMCVSTVSMSFLINGQVVGCLRPERGLRQGDPISPYLFLLCAEGLSARIRKAERENLLHGVKASSNGPHISHLSFADDSLIFGKETSVDVNNLKDMLCEYEKVSGKMINFEKSEMFFRCGVPEERRSSLCNVLNVNET
ncbi:RNA-directed DNA polymerase (reverse transcriptase) [Euphorbia peplus]|nr:RNA-directed DNA polymerase (reverse transcriptase) [Euphorbia peplus]